MIVGAPEVQTDATSAAAVFKNGSFLRLWLSQAATQIGGNMVLFGLMVIVRGSTGSNTAVSLLILSFLVPAVLFSAVAGVYVDRIDRRTILILTNLIRGVMYILLFVVGDNFGLIILLNILISTVTVFFAPAEASMIPTVVPRHQLIAANGIFILTLNAAFALGFALLGPVVVNIANPEILILIVALLFFVATIFCITLPSSPPRATRGQDGDVSAETEQAVESAFTQLREGLGYIRTHRNISWSLLYLGIAASLVGVLGVLGPDFAETTLGLEAKDFAVIVLPLGFGIVTGILLLNVYGKYLPRRRVIEGGLVSLGVMLFLLSVAGPLSRFLQQAEAAAGIVDLSVITSLLAIVVVIAFFAGIAYGSVAIPSQTQLQEDLPADVRGRVFGVLNMLVSVASFLPIIAVGPISDLIGTTPVILAVAVGIAAAGVTSIVRRGPLLPTESQTHADPHAVDPIAAALGADLPTWSDRDPRAGPVPTDAPVGTPVDPTRTPPPGRPFRRESESPSAFGGDAADRD